MLNYLIQLLLTQLKKQEIFSHLKSTKRLKKYVAIVNLFLKIKDRLQSGQRIYQALVKMHRVLCLNVVRNN